MTKLIRQVLASCLTMILIAVAFRLSAESNPITFSKNYVLAGGLQTTLTAVDKPEHNEAVYQVFEYAFNEVNKVATLLDATSPLSEISQLNLKAASGPVAVSPELMKLLLLTEKVYKWSDGWFDLAGESLGNFNHIKINEKKSTVKFSQAGTQINLDFIRDGYLADLLLITLYNAKMDNVAVSVGQANRSVGKDVVGPWKVAIKSPGGTYAYRGIALTYSGLSAATVNSERAPKVNPKTKAPLTPLVKSVTLIARDAATAQAIASAVYILGPTDGMELIKKLQNVRGVLSDLQGNLIRSPGL